MRDPLVVMKVIRVGNSLAVVIPSDICKLLGITAGKTLEVPLSVLQKGLGSTPF